MTDLQIHLDRMTSERRLYALRNLSGHLTEGRTKKDLYQLLLDFGWLQAKLNATSVYDLIVDLSLIPENETANLVCSAIRLSANILSKAPLQFAGQLHGRLMGSETKEVRILLQQALRYDAAPWLRPMHLSLTTPGGCVQQVLEEHESSVCFIAITADGKRAISVSDDCVLIVWDLSVGRPLATFEDCTLSERSVIISPDGKRAVYASQDNSLNILDLSKCVIVTSMRGHTDQVNSLALTPGGKRVVSASDDCTLKVWDLSSGDLLHTLEGHSDSVRSVAVTQRGGLVLIQA